MQWVSDVTVGKGTDKSVLVALANFHNAKRGECSPSIDTISAFTELNRKTVMPALDRLQQAGFISFEKGNRRHRKYTLHFDVYSPKTGTMKKRDNSPNLGTLEAGFKVPNTPSNSPNLGTLESGSKVPNTPPNSPNVGTMEQISKVPNATSHSPKHDLPKSQRLDHKQEEQEEQEKNPPIPPPGILTRFQSSSLNISTRWPTKNSNLSTPT